MLAELCKELKNWDFNHRAEKHIGDITINEGNLVGFDDKISENQYFRIVGSRFNDGIYQYPAENLTDETYHGAVWAMYIPIEVIELSDEIEQWKTKYESVNSSNMSPYTSESFGGYSYSKSGGGSSDGNAGSGTWQTAFANRLNKWRKI